MDCYGQGHETDTNTNGENHYDLGTDEPGARAVSGNGLMTYCQGALAVMRELRMGAYYGWYVAILICKAPYSIPSARYGLLHCGHGIVSTMVV